MLSSSSTSSSKLRCSSGSSPASSPLGTVGGDTLIAPDWTILGTRIKVPELLVLEGYGYSVPGHPCIPRRKSLHEMLKAAVNEFNDELDELAHGFLDFCRTRDSAVETWRLPGCEGGCKPARISGALEGGSRAGRRPASGVAGL